MSHLMDQAALQLLVVDDDRATRVLLAALFAGRNVVVHAMEDGATAIAAIRENHYDALILDLMVPGANGFAVVRELKNTQPGLLSRTVILTGASDVTLRDFADGGLVAAVMRKPIDIERLVPLVLSLTPVVQMVAAPPLRAQLLN